MAERVIRSLKGECLSHLMLFSKKQLELAVREYVQFYNTQRPHQGLDNEIPIAPAMENGEIVCKERLGGLLKSYERLVA
jgi:putative transposase